MPNVRTIPLPLAGSHVDSEDRQVGQELGVRYVLEGSVRKGGNRVRISAQLIDASTGNHVWAQRYEREIVRGTVRSPRPGLAGPAKPACSLRSKLGSQDASAAAEGARSGGHG